METKVLQPADRMTTAQCVIECSGYLRTIANQEFEGEDWQTAPKLRRQNLLTDFLCNLELSGEEFAELCGLIGFQLSKTTTAKLAKFTVIAYDWQSEANREATADILAALNKCEGVTLIEQRGYRPQARTYDYLRFHIAAFWRCLVNELRSLCLGVGLVVYPKEIPATPSETPRILTETAETVNVSAEGEKAAERAENNESAKLLTVIKRHEWGATPILFAYDPDKHIASATFKSISGDISVVNAKCDNDGYCHVYDSCMTIEELAWENMHAHNFIEPSQSPEAPQTVKCTTDTSKPRETARKPQNRGIGSARATRRDTLRDTLRPVTYVPRECSTADAAYW